MTLVVLNTVAAAQAVHRQLRGEGVTCTLLHPRLRGIERAARLADIAAPVEDMIVVTAQVAEGLDLSAAVLVTEAAPWPTLVQRAGRCNRDGAVLDAELWWLPQAGDDQDSDAACTELSGLEGTAVTTEDLATRTVPSGSRQVAAIGREEFAELFDTTAEIDVSAYLLDGDDLDVELAWATWTQERDGAPDPEVRYPSVEYRCRVPIGDALRLTGQRPVWQFDRSADQWMRLGGDPAARPKPLELLLVNATDGGYDPGCGFDPAASGPVPDSPELLTPDEIAERTAAEAPVPAGPPRPWQSLAEHSDQVRDQAAGLLTVLAPRISPDAARAAIVAAHLHDAGKAHPVWQDALSALAEESEAAAVAAGRPWAKSGKNGRLEFAGGAGFRHRTPTSPDTWSSRTTDCSASRSAMRANLRLPPMEWRRRR
jgi:CRISPR-associated endonuclease/helicase Cas3